MDAQAAPSRTCIVSCQLSASMHSGRHSTFGHRVSITLARCPRSTAQAHDKTSCGSYPWSSIALLHDLAAAARESIGRDICTSKNDSETAMPNKYAMQSSSPRDHLRYYMMDGALSSLSDMSSGSPVIDMLGEAQKRFDELITMA